MHDGSCECSKTELDVLSVPPTMVTMQESQWTEYFPVSSLNNNAPIEFVIPPQTEKWTDLSQSYLYMKLKVKTQDGNLDPDVNVSPVNNFFHSLFSSVDVYLNNNLITNNTDTYPYRAYIENLLSFNKESKKTHLCGGELWEKDTSGTMAIVNIDGDNKGLAKRHERITESKTLELCGRLHLDLFLQEKYLPNGIEIRIRLNRTSPKFCLIGGTGAPETQIVFETICFNVRNVELLPSVSNDLNRLIAEHNMKIPIRRVEVKSFTVSSGLRSITEEHLFQGQLPKRLFLGMVDNAAFNGTYNMNPFNFQPYNLSKLDVNCNGHSIYNRPFEPNFTEGVYLKSYLSLHQALGSLGLNKSFDITKEDFIGGFCLWGFDLTPDQGSEETQMHPIKTGNLRLELQFANPLPKVINVIVFAEYDNQITINSLREVILDY